jgi:hypothetical protein
MMARSRRSNRRPDTVMQDRINQGRRKPLAPHGRTIQWVITRTPLSGSHVRFRQLRTSRRIRPRQLCAKKRHPHQFAAHRPRSMRRHGVEFGDRVEVVDPCLLRANKYLPAWYQFISLAQRSNPHVVGFWLIANRCRIERRAAVRAETLQADVSAIGGLSIFCRFAGEEHERAWTSDNDRSQRSTAHCLAVCAVANGRRFWIGFGLERHVTAVTASIDFHARFPPQKGEIVAVLRAGS